MTAVEQQSEIKLSDVVDRLIQYANNLPNDASFKLNDAGYKFTQLNGDLVVTRTYGEENFQFLFKDGQCFVFKDAKQIDDKEFLRRCVSKVLSELHMVMEAGTDLDECKITNLFKVGENPYGYLRQILTDNDSGDMTLQTHRHSYKDGAFHFLKESGANKDDLLIGYDAFYGGGSFDGHSAAHVKITPEGEFELFISYAPDVNCDSPEVQMEYLTNYFIKWYSAYIKNVVEQ